MNRIVFPMLLVIAGCSSPSGEPASRSAKPIAPPSLEAAHRAYLDGDLLALGDRIHDVLLDPSSSHLAKQNAFELLEKAYETSGGKLPSRFNLPAGYESLHLGYFHVATPHGPHYEIHMRILAADTSHIRGFSVRRLPGAVLLDKEAGIGHAYIRRDPAARSAGLEELIINSGPIETPPEDGVVEFRLSLDDGRTSEGFAITHNLASTTTPEINVPESSSDPRPTIGWKPFVTPLYASHERRAIVIHVQDTRDHAMAWEFSTTKADERNEVRVGTGGWPENAKLGPGDYWVDVSEGEKRAFGPVLLVRLSRTGRNMRIVP